MKTRFIALLAMFAMPLAFSFSGCGNVCDDAADICGAGEGEGEEGECSGAAECAAQCIVDADSCDVTDPDLAECITGCAG
jgi:hypothetical protein